MEFNQLSCLPVSCSFCAKAPPATPHHDPLKPSHQVAFVLHIEHVVAINLMSHLGIVLYIDVP